MALWISRTATVAMTFFSLSMASSFLLWHDKKTAYQVWAGPVAPLRLCSAQAIMRFIIETSRMTTMRAWTTLLAVMMSLSASAATVAAAAADAGPRLDRRRPGARRLGRAGRARQDRGGRPGGRHRRARWRRAHRAARQDLDTRPDGFALACAAASV